MILQRSVAVKSIVTDQLRTELVAEVEGNIHQAHQELVQLEEHVKQQISNVQLRPDGLPAGMKMRKQWEAEKAGRLQQIQELEARVVAAKALKNGDVISRGQVNSWIEVQVGDNLKALSHAEIIVVDDVIKEVKDA